MSITHLDVSSKSSTIKNIRYCDVCEKLAIQFKSERVYVLYNGVDIDTFFEFEGAESFGEYYSRYIKSRYNCDIKEIGDVICDCSSIKKEIKKEEKDLFCRSCGTKFDEEDNFCGRCGKERA